MKMRPTVGRITFIRKGLIPDTTLTLGSLFDGIGVFPLAGVRHGITPVWASEIERVPISITRRHFPGMIHLGDITQLHGGAIPPVDIITFGSPCQNLSQIGKREGLAGAKSSLFHHAIRIIREMRCATDDQYPTIAIWENVMGALSSGNRMDFLSVLSAFQGADVPMPPTGRWANAGWCEGAAPIWPGGSWTPSVGQGPTSPDGSGSSWWRILEGGVLPKYCLSPAQCSHYLRLAARAGCPPPAEIEALFLKQGGAYPSPDPFSSTA